MKPCVNLILLLIMLFGGSTLSRGQESASCDQLGEKIAQLEKLDPSKMSASVREIHKESLLTLYTQISSCIDSDISALHSMQSAVASTNAAPVVESKLRVLQKDKQDIDRKILLLGAAPAANGANPAAEPILADRGNETSADSSTRPATPRSASNPLTSSLASRPSPQAAPTCEPGADYGEAPIILTDIVARAAADVVRRKDPNRAIFPITQMMLYTVFDAASPTSSRMVRELDAYQYLSETARTDKQLGASANSEGAVSAIEKPGFASLLGFAVEHGAINKKNDGTNLTLSTSLYSLYTLNKQRTAETYKNAGALNRVGVSASFAVDNTTDELANARRNNLTEWSVKARLFGDRSTRSPGFQKFWNIKVRPLISERLQSLGSAVESLSTRLDSYDAIERATRRCLPDLVRQRMADADYVAATEDGKKKIVSDLILSHLKTNVFDRVQTGSLRLSDKEIADVEQEFLPRLKTALDNLVLADQEIKKNIEELKKGPLATFSYTNHRIPTGSDYSDTNFLFEQDKGFFGPLKLTGNVGLSFYNKPDPTLNQQRLRDITAALSFEGASDSPFTEGENQSKIIYSFVGRYERLFENRNVANRTPDIRVFQFVTEIPFVRGFSLPLSVTYANATEEEKKQGFRFNFGMRLDTDKLFELLGKSKP